MPPGTTSRGQFVTDELVVAIPHQRLVLGELAGLDRLVTDARIIRSSAALGLCVINVRHARPDADDQAAALMALIGTVRERCAERYGGWEPTMGKNRLLAQVGGVGDPMPCDAPAQPSVEHGDRGRDVKVAVLDAGSPGHATFVAGLVRQRAPLADVETHCIADEPATSWDIAVTMTELAGPDVLNLSLGCYTADGAPPMLLKRAVDILGPHVVVVAPAGDHGQETTAPFWPAALGDVVAVGAHDGGGHRAAFSPDMPWITLSAPGADLSGPHPSGEGYASWSGTAFAAATVTGEVAAGAVPGKRDAREALNDLLSQSPCQPGADIWAYDHRLEP